LGQGAGQEESPYSVQAAPQDTGTDADAIYNALRGIPTGLVSVPNRYMHSPNEMVAREDLEQPCRTLEVLPGHHFVRAVHVPVGDGHEPGGDAAQRVVDRVGVGAGVLRRRLHAVGAFLLPGALAE